MVKVSHLEYRVVTYLESLYPGEVESSFNSVKRRRYAGSLPDAVIERLKTLYYVNGCRFHPHWIKNKKGEDAPCRLMSPDASPDSKTIFNETFKSAYDRFENMKRQILSTCSQEVLKMGPWQL